MPPFAVLPGPIASTGVDIPHGQSAGWLGRLRPVPPGAIRPPDFDRVGLDPRGLDRAGEFARLGRADRLTPRTGQTRRSATSMDGQPSDRAACWPGGWSRRACAWSRSTCSRRSSTASPGTATARPPSARWTTTPRELLPTFDQAFAALIDDLERRGAGNDAGGRRGRVRPHAPAQRLGRPRPLAGRLERRPGRRRHPGRPGRRRQRRACRPRPPTGPSRHRTCWPRSITAWASTSDAVPASDPTASRIALVEDGAADPRIVRLNRRRSTRHSLRRGLEPPAALYPGAAMMVRSSLPSARFQSRTSPSQLPEATVLPSREIASE